jgi:uncharacterized protein YcbX
VLRIQDGESEAAWGDLRTEKGRAVIENFFATSLADELHGAPKILHAEGHSFSDVAKKVISIINLASVTALEDVAGAPIDPLRFRGNLHVEGWPAWHEFALGSGELSIGRDVRVKLVKRIERCAATEVEPGTGLRDLPILRTLQRGFGHVDCGVYATVTGAGDIALGDEVA